MPATVSDLLAGLGPLPAHVSRAVETVPRHHFVAEIYSSDAYKDTALPIGHGVTASRPSIVVKMLSLLGERKKVLEVGTGSGWQTALLSTFAETYSVEFNRLLYQRAVRDLARYPVHLRCGDGLQGWPDAAPFDGIIVCAAVAEFPKVLFRQLTDDGVMVYPAGDGQSQFLCSANARGGIEYHGACGFGVAV